MFKLFILLTLIFLLILFVRELKRYLTTEKKEEELRKTFTEGDLVDIELEIAEEKSRQEKVRSKMNELKSKNSMHNKEHDNDQNNPH